MNNDTRFYIDGAWLDRPDVAKIAVTNPYSEEVIGHIAVGSPAEVDLAVAAARRAFETFSQSSVVDRLALLTRIRDLLEERAEQFAQAIVAEMGAAIGFARAGQCYFGRMDGTCGRYDHRRCGYAQHHGGIQRYSDSG